MLDTLDTPNTNCLEDIRCPECGNTSRFTIVALVDADVSDDGAEFHGDAEWDDDSRITCPKCNRTGNLKEFKAKPQDKIHAVDTSHYRSCALFDALLGIKRLAGKAGDHEADPFALLNLIVERVREAIASEKPSEAIEWFRKLLAQRGYVASLWNTEDVQSLRPDLSDEQSMVVLDECMRRHDAEIGINWYVIGFHADNLFPKDNIASEEK